MQETIVRLKVVSTAQTPELITKVVGIPCERGWHIGDTRPNTIIKEKNHGWELGSGLPRSASLEEHIGALMSVLEPKAERIKSLAPVAQIELSCVIYFDDATPALWFHPTLIAALERLGASLDIDLYALGAEPTDISESS